MMRAAFVATEDVVAVLQLATRLPSAWGLCAVLSLVICWCVPTSSQAASTSLAAPLQPPPPPPLPAGSLQLVLDLYLSDSTVLGWLNQSFRAHNRTWAWGINAEPNTSLADLAAVRAMGLVPMLTGVDASPTTRRRHAASRQRAEPNLTADLEAHLAAAGGRAADVLWEAFTEEDSAGFGFSQELMLNTSSLFTQHDQAQARCRQRAGTGCRAQIVTSSSCDAS
jgi:hypothetical protein